MKTQIEKFKNLDETSFESLKNDELIQIKGGTEDSQGGTPTQKDGEFD